MDHHFSRFTNIFEIICRYESVVKDDDLVEVRSNLNKEMKLADLFFKK